MFYSKTAQYSLQAMLYIAANQSEKNILARDVASRLGLPLSFLGKILQQLSKAGLLISVKGPRGGFTLSKSGAEASPADIIALIDGPLPWDECLLGFAECSDEEPCPIHGTWTKVRHTLKGQLEKKTLVELSRQMPERYLATSRKSGSGKGKPSSAKTPSGSKRKR